MTLRKALLAFVVAAVPTLPLLAQTTTTTTNTVTRTITLPPAGLGTTETAQLNVVNVANSPTGGNAASCVGSISFLSAAGTAIGSASPFTIASGQLTSASLPFSSAGITGVRGEIRGQIQLTLTAGVPCSVTYSFETFDSTTGDTHLYLARQTTEETIFPAPFIGR
jgi:hypothetical protein